MGSNRTDLANPGERQEEIFFNDCLRNNSVIVPPPVDPSNLDQCFYTNMNPQLAVASWTDDGAFWPSTITYAVTFVVGVIGNILVIFALTADRKSRNVTSSFLISLAVADLTFLLICVPHDLISKLSVYWVGGVALCKIAKFTEMLTASASILNLTAVSVERYAVIVHPMKSRSWCTMGNTKRIIVGVWIVACMFSSPLLHIMQVEVTLYYDNSTYVMTATCHDALLEEKSQRVAFAWYQMIVLFIMPAVVMVFCYAVVIHVLWISTKQLARMTNTTNSEDESKQRLTSNSPRHQIVVTKAVVRDRNAEISDARKQVIRMLLAIIAVFFLCWGPKLIYHLMKNHELQAIQNNAGFYFSILINLLPYVQSCSNPIIYGFMSNNFRRSMRTGCIKVCRCDPGSKCARTPRRNDFDMETKTNGASGKYSPSMTSRSMVRSYVTGMSEM